MSEKQHSKNLEKNIQVPLNAPPASGDENLCESCGTKRLAAEMHIVEGIAKKIRDQSEVPEPSTSSHSQFACSTENVQDDIPPRNVNELLCRLEERLTVPSVTKVVYEHYVLPPNIEVFLKTSPEKAKNIMAAKSVVSLTLNWPPHVNHVVSVVSQTLYSTFSFKKAGERKWKPIMYILFLFECMENKELLINPQNNTFEQVVQILNDVFPELNTNTGECCKSWWEFATLFDALKQKMKLNKLDDCLLLPKGNCRVLGILCHALASENVFLDPKAPEDDKQRETLIQDVIQFLCDCLRELEETPVPPLCIHMTDMVQFFCDYPRELEGTPSNPVCSHTTEMVRSLCHVKILAHLSVIREHCRHFDISSAENLSTALKLVLSLDKGE